MSEGEKYSVFQQALIDSVLIEYQCIPEEKALPDSFTPEFKQWADRCIYWSKTGRFRWTSLMKKLLVAAIIAALLVGTAMAIPVIRKVVIDFLFITYDERIGITFNPEQAATAPEVIETPWGIHYAPDGYTLVVKDISPTTVTMVWLNENGDCINFSQWSMRENPEADSWIGLDIADTQEKVLMGDYLVEIVYTSDNRKLIWTDNAYFFILEVPAYLEKEETYKMFGSFGILE